MRSASSRWLAACTSVSLRKTFNEARISLTQHVCQMDTSEAQHSYDTNPTSSMPMGTLASLANFWAYSSSIFVLRSRSTCQPLSFTQRTCTLLHHYRTIAPTPSPHDSTNTLSHTARTCLKNTTHLSCQKFLSSSVVLSAPLILANKIFGPVSPCPQNALQKSRFSYPWNGSTPFVLGGAYLANDVTLACARA